MTKFPRLIGSCVNTSTLVVLASCASPTTHAAPPHPPLWESAYTHAPPVIDGLWQNASPLSVVLREAVGADRPRTVELRALHTDEMLYVLAQWADATRSDMRDPYVWNAQKSGYERQSKPDDQFVLEFPLSGNFAVNMLTLTHEFTADVWHWKFGRGNPAGWVDDKRHIIGPNEMEGAKEYRMGGHGTVYIARMMDEGRPSYTLKPKPQAFAANVVDSFGTATAKREPSRCTW